MTTTIAYKGIDIVIMESDQTPQVQCNPGDFFIRQEADGGYWVYGWDGREVFGMGDDPVESLNDAIAWAKECAECQAQVHY